MVCILFPMHRLRPAAAAATAAALALGAAPAAHAQTPAVTQGERIRIGENSFCTLGFIDASRNRGFTAAHCGRSGESVSVFRGGEWVKVGWFRASSFYDPPGTGNDWANVNFNSSVALGANSLSGDAQVAPGEVRAGERVCFQGSATRVTNCADALGSLGGNVYWKDTGARAGDSGAPVWVEKDGAKRFVGVLAGHNVVSVTGRPDIKVLRASTPEDANGPSDRDEIDLIARHYGIRGTQTVLVLPVVVPAGGNQAQPQPAPEGSADVETVTIAVIVVLGLLALAAPAALSFIQGGQLPF